LFTYLLTTPKKRPQAALVGSSNVTRGGLIDNYEANVLVIEHSGLRELVRFFEELFDGGHATAVTKRWLDQYRRAWTRREQLRKAEESIRQKVRKIGRTDRAKSPRRIKGKTIAFTGRIRDWPRERVLYPRVRRLGGDIVLRANGLGRADYLVHADLLGANESTLKLKEARARGVPVISEEEFFDTYTRERGARGK
jgi:NAD-dependent DNA ligase